MNDAVREFCIGAALSIIIRSAKTRPIRSGERSSLPRRNRRTVKGRDTELTEMEQEDGEIVLAEDLGTAITATNTN